MLSAAQRNIPPSVIYRSSLVHGVIARNLTYVTRIAVSSRSLANNQSPFATFGTMMAQPGDDAAKDMQERDEALWEQNKK